MKQDKKSKEDRSKKRRGKAKKVWRVNKDKIDISLQNFIEGNPLMAGIAEEMEMMDLKKSRPLRKKGTTVCR